MKNQQTAGFTLIELLVVAALSVIIIVGASSLFYTALISNSTKDTLTAVKQEGDFALGQMEFLLRNAVSLESKTPGSALPICDKNMSSITFRERDERITTLGFVEDSDHITRIASSSASVSGDPKISYLTSSAVQLIDPINHGNATTLFDCELTSSAGAYISIHFTLNKANTGFGADTSNETQSFNTSVNLRSF